MLEVYFGLCTMGRRTTQQSGGGGGAKFWVQAGRGVGCNDVTTPEPL